MCSLTHSPVDVKSGAEAAKYLKDSKHICILTGAGLSAASGIPTYRMASDAFWENEYAGIKDPKKICTLEFMNKNPEFFWKWSFDFQDVVKNAKPNAGHYAIEKFMSW